MASIECATAERSAELKPKRIRLINPDAQLALECPPTAPINEPIKRPNETMEIEL